MFDFFSMANNYEQRKVDHTDLGGSAWVDTAAVTDAAQPYETAVEHPRYNDGEMVIVELYDTKDQAQIGHDKWVALMSGDTLPASLKDVSTAGVALLLDAVSDDEWRTRTADATK